MPRTGDLGCSAVVVAFLAAALALLACTAHAQCGYQPQYGVWQPTVDIPVARWCIVNGQQMYGYMEILDTGQQVFVIVPEPQPVVSCPPPAVVVQFGFGGRPSFGPRPNFGNGGYGGSPAFQQGYDSRWRQHAREQQNKQDSAAHAAGQRAANRAWGIGPTGGGHRRR